MFFYTLFLLNTTIDPNINKVITTPQITIAKANSEISPVPFKSESVPLKSDIGLNRAAFGTIEIILRVITTARQLSRLPNMLPKRVPPKISNDIINIPNSHGAPKTIKILSIVPISQKCAVYK
jgi:hypothetical protein